jgi:pimeloyl-ACP methyl ester carboxylesterase
LAAVEGVASDNAYLVGHSMGGMVIPRMAFQRPKARLIFLCAGFAHSNEAEHAEGLDATRPDFFSKLTIDSQGCLTMTAENAIALFYQDVEPELAKWAVSTLRPQWHESFAKVGPVSPYAERVAHVIYTTEDEIIDPAKHRAMAEKRFGIKPIALPGGHSPFLSHPAELADVLNRIVVADMAGERYSPN